MAKYFYFFFLKRAFPPVARTRDRGSACLRPGHRANGINDTVGYSAVSGGCMPFQNRVIFKAAATASMPNAQLMCPPRAPEVVLEK